MLRIEVDPDSLMVAASDHIVVGDALAGVGGDLADSASSAVADAGDPSLGRGIGAAAEQFGAGVSSLHAEMHGLAGNLSAAARVYRDTDESVIPPA